MGEWEADGREVPIHFPDIGPLQFWPEAINLNAFEENSPRWRRAVLTRITQDEKPGLKQIDVDQSAVVGLKLPDIRDGHFWVAAETWFPTSRLKEVFPELNRICGRFERFLQKYPVVSDTTKGDDSSEFRDQLCMAGVMQRVVALPDAMKILQDGGGMIDALSSAGQYEHFLWKRRASGHAV